MLRGITSFEPTDWHEVCKSRVSSRCFQELVETQALAASTNETLGGLAMSIH